jgi:uncharacterized membrane protein YbhN (UPF0104 family)
VYKPIVRIVVTALLLYGLLQLVSATDVLAVITSFAPVQFLLPFFVVLMVELVVAMRLVLLLKIQRVEIPFSHVLGINLSTRFFGLWLPGGNVTGFGVRVLQTARFSGDMAGSIAAIAADRLFATGTLFLVGALSILLDVTTTQVTFVVPSYFFRIALPIVLAFFVGALATLFLSRRLVPAFLAKSIKYANSSFIRFRELFYWPAFVAIALSMLAHVLGTWVFYMVARSIGLDFDIWAILWVRAVLMISALLPISVGGLGVREATALFLLPLYGVSQEAAIAFALLTFFVCQLSIGLIGGLVSMMWASKRRARESARE